MARTRRRMTRLGNCQFPTLKAFAEAHHHIRIEEAQAFDQRPFRSMLIQGRIKCWPGCGFHITREGRTAWREVLLTEIVRKDPTRLLVDPTACRLAVPKKRPHIVAA